VRLSGRLPEDSVTLAGNGKVLRNSLTPSARSSNFILARRTKNPRDIIILFAAISAGLV
jgi:hypothetical protein